MRAKLTILGAQQHNANLWDGFNVPVGMDKQTAINKIIYDNVSFGLIYADTNVIMDMITNWCAVNLPNWERAYAALISTYNPIHNYDKHEDWTEESSSTGTSSETSTDGGTNTNQKAGFNQTAGWTDNSKDTYSDSGTKELESGVDEDSNRHGHIYGNIGVTTSQQMIEAEMELRSRYNVYEMISTSFRSEFCVMVY